MTFDQAVEQAKSGFVITREKWLDEGAYAFWAVSGNVIAFDKTSARLEPCLIVTARGLNIPYLASPEDREARDWIALTRQQAEHGA